MQGKINNDVALNFMLAGKCDVTLVSHKTGNKLTYTISKKKSEYSTNDEYLYFISVGHAKSLLYAGFIVYSDIEDKFKFVRGNKGNLNLSDIRVKSILYTLNQLNKENYNLGVDIYHCGRCGKCGRKLTDPVSISIGLGPKCAGYEWSMAKQSMGIKK